MRNLLHTDDLVSINEHFALALLTHTTPQDLPRKILYAYRPFLEALA